MSVNFTTDEIVFCLDNNPLEIEQSNESSVVAKMYLQMHFEGYGNDPYNLLQIYEQVFFEGKAMFYPGEEVQDFFAEVNHFSQIRINESEVVPSLLFNAASVNIVVKEFDSDNRVQKTYELNNLYFLPGKKPMAFPYLTGSQIRTTYSGSLIMLSVLGKYMNAEKLNKINGNPVDVSSVTDEYAVYSLTIKRSELDLIFGNQKIVKDSLIAFEPIPTPRDSIDAIFINQNLCPEWFTFSGEWEEHTELNQILSKHTERGVDFKAKVDRKNTFKLNTGWLFEEELGLLSEMMQSKYCWIRIQSEWIRCIPISKKVLPYDSERNVNSQIVEFQKVTENER